MNEPRYRALRITQEEHDHRCVLTEITVDELGEGNVVIAPEYSAINYKDALAGTGSAPILRTSPLIGGIDAAGTVLQSDDTRLSVGQSVLITGCGLSETRNGGYCERLRIPGEFPIEIPAPFTARSAMLMGTAGFTAMLGIERLQDNHVSPDSGPILVTGASGGVGSLSLLLLHRLGYSCIALTGKPDAHDRLTQLGADEIWTPEQLQHDARGLAHADIAGAIDNLGGTSLPALARITRPWGCIVSVGIATGMTFEGSVAPFVIRGVSILGVTSANCPLQRRQDAWHRLFQTLQPSDLEQIDTQTVSLEDVPKHFARFLEGRATGRTLVQIAPTTL